MGNGRKRTLIIGAPILAALLSACGVKGLPTAPGGEGTPGAVVEPERAGEGDILGIDDRDAADPLTGPRITSRTSGLDDDERVTAAEVARTRGASNRSFFLDPLLN